MRITLLIILASLFLSSCDRTNDSKASKPVLVLRYADNQSYDYPTSRAARYFAELVREKTGGDIEILVYSSGELGNEIQVYEQMKYGGVDFSRFSIGITSMFYESFAVLGLPYLYEDSEHMWRVLDSEIGDYFIEETRKTPVIGLAWFDAGARNFYLRNPLSFYKDISEMKIRVQETDVMAKSIEQLGPEAVKIPYGDVYSALQKFLIDGAENNLPSILHTGHYEVAKYIYMDEHFRLPEIIMMSEACKRKIEECNPEYLTVIEESAKEASLYERKLWQEEEQKAYRLLKEYGCEFIYPTEEQMDILRERMAPIYEDFSSYASLIEKIRQA